MTDTAISPALLTVDEAAERLRCSRVIVYRAVRHGRLRAVRLGTDHGPLRIPTDALGARDTGGRRPLSVALPEVEAALERFGPLSADKLAARLHVRRRIVLDVLHRHPANRPQRPAAAGVALPPRSEPRVGLFASRGARFLDVERPHEGACRARARSGGGRGRGHRLLPTAGCTIGSRR
jgi:excisionase family DNA binding protein